MFMDYQIEGRAYTKSEADTLNAAMHKAMRLSEKLTDSTSELTLF